MSLVRPNLDTLILETRRTRMRPHRLEDYDKIHVLWSDPAVTAFIGGQPLTREETWFRFLRGLGHWHAFSCGFWLVEDRETGELLGEVGFADFKRAIEPSHSGQPEMGWVLSGKVHGKGYASETVTAALEWGKRNLTADKIFCIIDAKNTNSIRVAKRFGFRETARTTYKEKPIITYERSFS
jgi:RimJ/RimL family protein N-acetyltransferase